MTADMETLVIMSTYELEAGPPGYFMEDMVQRKEYRLFTDYEKARKWAEEWVIEYNKTIKVTKRDESGEFVYLDEPVLVEVEPNYWDCFLTEVIHISGRKDKGIETGGNNQNALAI